jgi:hypothetical protein
VGHPPIRKSNLRDAALKAAALRINLERLRSHPTRKGYVREHGLSARARDVAPTEGLCALFELGVRALVEGRAQHGLDLGAKVAGGGIAFVFGEGVFVLPDLI